MKAATPSRAARERRIALGILLAIGVVSQVFILAQQLESDPLALSPVNDARVYWQWAGEIAAGKLVGATPFLSAPLYPYLLGILRALGGGLAAAYVAQALLHVVTAGWLFLLVEKRFGFLAAVVGTGLYLALLEPAYHTARILNCTLQLFVVVALWDRLIAASEEPRTGRLLGLGAVLGVNVLANPTMLAAVPLAALWILWIRGFGASGLRAAATVAAAALLAIAPATLHNWLACHELIAVSAQGGVTFYHGNAPGAEGTYHGIPGIAENRIQQNIDARSLLGDTTDGSWNATSSAFFRKGLEYWKSDPAAALRLFREKVWFFLSGRNYGDIYVPDFEREDGMASRLALAPLPTAWLTLPALLALAFLLRDPRRAFPEALLVLAPLLTVATFWYSPRYRMPAVPLLAGLSGFALASMVRFLRPALVHECEEESPSPIRSPVQAGVFALAFLVSILSGAWNRKTGFDDPASLRGQFQQEIGGVLVEQNRLSDAEPRFRAAVAAGYPPAQAALADVLRRQGRREEALSALRAAVLSQPESAYAHRSLAVVLAEGQVYTEAEQEFRAALSRDPNDWESLSGLGNVLHATGRVDEAIAMHRSAIERNPAFAPAHYNLGCVYYGQKRWADAEQEFQETLRADRGLGAARWYLAEIWIGRGDYGRAIDVLREGLKLAPGDPLLLQELQKAQAGSKGR